MQVFFCFYNSWHWKFLSDVEDGLFYYFILWNEIGYVSLQTLATKLLLSASVTPAVKEKSGSEKSARTHEKKTFIKSQYTYSKVYEYVSWWSVKSQFHELSNILKGKYCISGALNLKARHLKAFKIQQNFSNSALNGNRTLVVGSALKGL